jgi:peptide/nickel transport system substrate-binding protein
MGNVGVLDNPNDKRYSCVCLEQLIRTDFNGNYVPWLAESWKIADDKKSVTFSLKKGVKYHDGTPFNAQSVKDCLDIARTGEFAQLKTVTSIDVVDEYTVRLNMPQFDWSVMSGLSFGTVGLMASPTAIKSHEKEWSFTNPVGTGPFKFKEYKRDVSVTFERNPDYWDKGKPYLDGVVFKIMANPTTALMSFKAGEADVLAVLTPADVADLQKAGYNVAITTDSIQMYYPDSNDPNSPWSNIKVRQAANHAIDVKSLAKNIGYGLYDWSNQPWNWGSWANNPNIKGYPYDPAAAKKLLSDAGFGNGFKTKITIVQGMPKDTHVAVQDYFRAVGIDCAIDEISFPNFAHMAPTGWSGLAFGGSPGRGLDPAYSMGVGTVTFGSTWVSSKREPALEAKVREANAEVDTAKRKALMQEVSRMMVDDYAMYIFLYCTKGLTATTNKVQNLGLEQYWLWTPANAWLKK